MDAGKLALCKNIFILEAEIGSHKNKMQTKSSDKSSIHPPPPAPHAPLYILKQILHANKRFLVSHMPLLSLEIATVCQFSRTVLNIMT